MIIQSKLTAFGFTCGLVLAGCSHAPDSYLAPTESCDLALYAHNLEIKLPDGERLLSGPDFQTTQAKAIEDVRGPLLFLSGGSQHGAFGAGYLDEWAKLEGGLPEFSVVTGVSTGALQSTAAFINKPELAVQVAAIQSESEILETYVDGSQVDGGLKEGAALSLIRRGAISDLVPLRSRLDELITHEVMLQVAGETDNKRKLYVGVTDFDTGGAVAMDMTFLAQLYRDNPSKRRTYKTCYREILIASSIVPVAAKPVFIENRMFIDGGVRFGVFTEEIGPLLYEKNERFKMMAVPSPKTPVHIILNGDGVPSRQCGKPKEFCDGDKPRNIMEGPHNKWSFPSLAVRSVDLLSNQVSRLSIYRAENLQRSFETDVKFARIKEADKNLFPLDSDLLPESLRPATRQTLSCAAWRKLDDDPPVDKNGKKANQPVEFHPRYMHCVIAYGRSIAHRDFGKPKS